MAKAVNSALSAVNWEAKTYIELIGVVGVQESRHVLTAPFGQSRADVAPALEDIGNRYEWTLTPENYKRVLAELDTLKRRLEESRPIHDERHTPEQEAARVAEQNGREQDRAIETRAKDADRDRILADLKTRYPWAKQDGSDHARASANIKRELAQAFPGIRFQVRSDSFSGGDSVDVRWENGPMSAEVEAITGKYQHGSFDGMQDLYEYDHSAFAEAVGTWLGSAKYVQKTREYSEAVLFTTARLLCEAQHIDYKQPEHVYELRNVYHLYGAGDGEDLLTHVYRLLSPLSFPAVFEVVGLKDDPENGHQEPYTLELKAPARTTAAASVEVVTRETDGTLKGHIEKHYHTKHGFDFWLVVLAGRVDGDTFSTLRKLCEAAGGWYSRKWGKCPGGFAFKDEEKAKAFLAAI